MGNSKKELPVFLSKKINKIKKILLDVRFVCYTAIIRQYEGEMNGYDKGYCSKGRGFHRYSF